jgi:hypothetical protein
MAKTVHFIGFNATACGLPFTLDILLSGRPARTTCRNCIRTAAHRKAMNPVKSEEVFSGDFEQPELFEKATVKEM